VGELSCEARSGVDAAKMRYKTAVGYLLKDGHLSNFRIFKEQHEKARKERHFVPHFYPVRCLDFIEWGLDERK
jgi:hypothetical protein